MEEARALMDELFAVRFIAWGKENAPPRSYSFSIVRWPGRSEVSRTASAYTVQDRHVLVDGGEIVVRCTVPVVEDDDERFPLLFNVHGGCTSCSTFDTGIIVFTYVSLAAWVSGGIDMEDYYLRRLCVDLKIATVNVDYRYVQGRYYPRYRAEPARNPASLAPEHPFPTPGNDCLQALKWVRRA